MITHEITLDMQLHGRPVILHAPKGEREARQVQISLVNHGTPWEAPEGAAMTVSYKRRNGTGGSYSKLSDGTTSAVTLNAARTVATVTLIEDVLAYGVPVEMNLTFQAGTQRTITAGWIIVVDQLSEGKDLALHIYNGEVE